MTKLIATAAIALVATFANVAAAQDAGDLRAQCAELEALQTPGVVDCYQAVADVEAAETVADADAVVRSYFETASPYDFQRTVQNASEAGPTLFDE